MNSVFLTVCESRKDNFLTLYKNAVTLYIQHPFWSRPRPRVKTHTPGDKIVFTILVDDFLVNMIMKSGFLIDA